jgi:DNA repair photolyase
MSDGNPPVGAASVGIAALVREGARERADLRCERVQVRRILVRSDPRPFAERWAIDAYAGCAFGCRYCGAPAEWRIAVRVEAPRLLEREASRWDLHARPIALGVEGDPYPPAESSYRLTQRLLEILGRARGLRLSLATRSTLIARDVEILRAAAQRSRLAVLLVLPALDEGLARKLDPGAPGVGARLAALRALIDAGVPAGICVPVLPGINDDPAALRAVLEAAARSRAGWASVRPVQGDAALRRRVCDWVRIRLPERLEAFRALAPPQGGVDPGWRADLRSTLAALRREIGLPAAPPALQARSVQLALPGLATPPRAA